MGIPRVPVLIFVLATALFLPLRHYLLSLRLCPYSLPKPRMTHLARKAYLMLHAFGNRIIERVELISHLSTQVTAHNSLLNDRNHRRKSKFTRFLLYHPRKVILRKLSHLIP